MTAEIINFNPAPEDKCSFFGSKKSAVTALIANESRTRFICNFCVKTAKQRTLPEAL
jgi:hypothetical protein